MTSRRLAPLALLCALLAPVAGAAEEIEDYRPIYKQLLSERAPAVVTVKFVISVTASGNEQRVEDRAQAIVVSPDGLLLVQDRAVSFDFSQMSGQRSTGASMVTKSSEFRVRLGEADDWQPADLVTRDAELGLAWLRVRNPPANLVYVDLANAGKVEPGLVFHTLLRSGDDWGAVPVWRPGLVLGEMRTPRHLFLVDGLPGLAFDSEARPVGYVDVNLEVIKNAKGSSMGLDPGFSMQLTPIDKIAQATAQAAKLPVVAGK